MDANQTYTLWKQALEGTEFSAPLAAMEKDPVLLKNCFAKDLEFGTAGMRGILGLGTNCINRFTVRRCTQGLANYLKAKGKEEAGVAIAYDSRRGSKEFALDSALVLAGNGVTVFLYDTLKSVPQLSFAILELGCAAGVVLTASHNPKEYNGYKVYGADGGQLAVEDAAELTSFIEAIADPFSIQPMKEEDARKSGKLHDIGKDLDEIYYQKVLSLSLSNPKELGDLKIVYTPLFGTGNVPVSQLLARRGVAHLHIVKEQQLPNGEFPGLSAPNPENPEAFVLATALAEKEGANLILATDPDCDRLGVAVRNQEGKFDVLSGNQIGCLLLEYILSHSKRTGNEFVVKSIVSTPMADKIAARHGVEMRRVLTGFRFIAEQIKESLATGKGRFLFGFEESYGFLAGTFVRDKDAAMAATLVAEMAADYLSRGMTLQDGLTQLYETYGYFAEKVLSLTLAGLDGIAKIKAAVDHLRENPPQAFLGRPIVRLSDLQLGYEKDLLSGETKALSLPASNVLCYQLEKGSVILRPSGTEPKLKAYLSIEGENAAQAKETLAHLEKEVQQLMQALTK